jgi:hypothetical protein
MSVTEEVPEELQAAATSALAWINETRRARFKITGIIDAEATTAKALEPFFELGLVLCEGDRCAREQVLVERLSDGFQVTAANLDDPLIPPLLDPPVGVRAGWLDAQLAKHAFTVLVFYRGFW